MLPLILSTIGLVIAPLAPPQGVPSPACASVEPRASAVAYTLSFPEPGLDDPAAYEGYGTRFYRDAAGNTLQIYVKASDGRVVNLWADAANESAGFTARDGAGRPVGLAWASDSACVAIMGTDRTIEYRLRAPGPELSIGHFVLGSMRVERDVQYMELHTRPYGPPHVLPELTGLIEALESLPAADRQRHVRLLGAEGTGELRTRLEPTIRLITRDGTRVARVEQPSLDARNELVLELAVPAAAAELRLEGHALRVSALGERPLELAVRVMTDAAALTPLERDDIFNSSFFAFFDSVRTAHDRAVADGAAGDDPRVLRFRRLERQVRGLELVSSREKLMAGLPNYATYFGRDMLSAALMMQPIWKPEMNEHVLGSVLRKLSPTGEVSHEEALGGQAIREHAAEYAALVERWRERRGAGDSLAARRLLREAEAVLEEPQRVRENYAMVDDEFQFPVLAARYLAAANVPAAAKRTFLEAPGRPDEPTPRLELLLRNLMLVADMTAAYAREPAAGNLVGFPRREDGRWAAASWRDSGVGYGNGRFAMDVNAIWVPQALEAISTILAGLGTLGYDPPDLLRSVPALSGSVLAGYMEDPESLEGAVETWHDSDRHFEVRLPEDSVRVRIGRKLASLSDPEARYWTAVLEADGVPEGGVAFRALSLDSVGRPIDIMNTDIATGWFLGDIGDRLLAEPDRVGPAVKELDAAFRPYPVGLLVERLGPLVANDAYATPDVWEAFERDTYHSPRVVWGREVNLVLLGLMKQLDATRAEDGSPRAPHLAPYVAAVESSLEKTLDAVEASGLKTNEVWSYRIEDGRLQPIRWGASTDVQLWNLTNLVVEYRLGGFR